MAWLTLLTILFQFITGVAVAEGQQFGGLKAARHGAGVRMHGGTSAIQTRSRFSSSLVGRRSPVKRRSQGKVVLRAPQPHFQWRVPVVVPRVAPQPRYYHRQPPLRRHSGIAIIDVPYAPQSTVITQVAPGVVREVRPQGESPSNEPSTGAPGQLAPFDPTPEELVDRMLSVASLKPGDVLYDLGAGDGRVVIAAAQKFAVRAVGFEIEPGLVKLARENVRKQGLESLVEIRQQDILSADLSPASVVTLHLSPEGNLAVRPKLMTELKPGTRVVSYSFDMGEWQAKIAERYRDNQGNTHRIYLWQMGEPLAFR